MINFTIPQEYTFIFKYFDVTKQKYCIKTFKERHRSQFLSFSANNSYVMFSTIPNIRNVFLTVVDKDNNIVWESVK